MMIEDDDDSLINIPIVVASNDDYDEDQD